MTGMTAAGSFFFNDLNPTHQLPIAADSVGPASAMVGFVVIGSARLVFTRIVRHQLLAVERPEFIQKLV